MVSIFLTRLTYIIAKIFLYLNADFVGIVSRLRDLPDFFAIRIAKEDALYSGSFVVVLGSPLLPPVIDLSF